MRKQLLLLLLTSFTSLSALDLKLDMGTGLYYTGAEGKIEYIGETFQNSYAATDLLTSGNFYIWADIETPYWFMPIFRFEYLKISADGDSVAHLESGIPELQQLIEFLEGTGLNDTNWNSHLTHNVYDMLAYYEFFEDSGWPSLGLGAGYRYFDYIYIMDITINGEPTGIEFGDRDSTNAPMLYLHSRYEMPSVNLGFEFNAKGYFGDSTLYDWDTKLDLSFDVDEDTRAGFEFGYREQYYLLSGGDVENVKGDMSYKGIFMGARIEFK